MFRWELKTARFSGEFHKHCVHATSADVRRESIELEMRIAGIYVKLAAQ